MTGAAPVTVRVAHPADVASAGALTAEAYVADGLLTDEDDYAAELRDAASRAAEATLLVAVLPTPDGHDAVVGTITVAACGSSYAEVAEPGEVELRMLAVAPEVRGRGVAAGLVRAALREAIAEGARRVVLSTLDAMAAARRLYAGMGFVAEPERDWGHEDVRLRVLTWTPPEAPGPLVETQTWPPARVVVTPDGWRCGLSGGFTQRANSALPLGRPADLGAAVARVEAVYDEAGQPPVFRIGAGAPDGLALVLAVRGYVARSRTDVMVRSLAAARAAGGGAAGGAVGEGLTVRVSTEPDEAWLRAWLGVKGPGVDPSAVRAVLTGAPAHYLSATSGGAPVGTLRVGYAEEWAGLSCLAVEPSARRGGIGRALTRHGLALAAQRGAARAFLQVEAANSGAASLYERLGFVLADGYRYVAPAE